MNPNYVWVVERSQDGTHWRPTSAAGVLQRDAVVLMRTWQANLWKKGPLTDRFRVRKYVALEEANDDDL